MPSKKRDHVLSVARRMFCTLGFHAVSIDQVIEEAEVARMTVYKNFGSKEELMAAALRDEDREFRAWLASAVESRSTRPEDRIRQLFLALHSRFSQEGYYGCAFLRASIEFPDPRHPAHRAAKEHKEMIRTYLRGLAADTGAENPARLAEQIYLLFEGAIAASQLHGDPWPADYAGEAALQLVRAAGGTISNRKRRAPVLS